MRNEEFSAEGCEEDHACGNGESGQGINEWRHTVRRKYHAITLELQSLVAQHTDRAKFSELGVDHIKYDEQSLKSRLENTVGCQIALLGAFGMTFMVSSLFANIICTVSLPVASILAVIFFKDNMDAIKIISILLGLWALVSYVFGAHRNSKVSTSRTGSQPRAN